MDSVTGWDVSTAGAPGSIGPTPGRCDFRRTIHDNKLASIENASVSKSAPLPEGHESNYQVVLAYAGLFTYRVGNRRWHIDSNKTLLISPGWEFRDEHPLRNYGHACVLINPSRELMDEICGIGGASRHPAFLAGSLRSTRRLRLLNAWILRSEQNHDDLLWKDEWIVRALQEAIQGRPSAPRRSSRMVDRAKEMLHDSGFERLSLTDIAKNVGASPAYLTQEFTRSEGIPLYQYQLALRMGRALLELPHCDDITALALDLGFSSHSHFSSAFRKWYGLTPSTYRNSPAIPGLFGGKPSFGEIRARVLRNPIACSRSIGFVPLSQAQRILPYA